MRAARTSAQRPELAPNWKFQCPLSMFSGSTIPCSFIGHSSGDTGRSDRDLESQARAESDLFAGLDLDRFTRRDALMSALGQKQTCALQ
jgi:hypothetical protein